MVIHQLQPLPQCVGKAVFWSSDLGVLCLQELTTLQRISAPYWVCTGKHQDTESFWMQCAE